MNEELKKQFDLIREDLGKNAVALAKVDALEQAALQREADVKAIRAELDLVRKAHEDREKVIVDLQRQAQVLAVQHDPIRDRREAVETFGMLCRASLCRHLNMEVPAEFKPEEALIRTRIQRATLSSLAATGTYLVPTITQGQLIDTLEEISDLVSRVEFIPGLPAASTIYVPTLLTRPTLKTARATTDTTMTASDPTFGQMELSPSEAYVFFPIDNRLVQMAAIDLGNLAMNLLRDSIAEGMADWLLNADGTSTYNSFTGILKEATYVSNMAAGKKAFSDLDIAIMRTMKNATLKRGRARGSWLMSADILGLAEEFDRSGKTPGVTYAPDGSPKFMGNPVVVEEGMPDIADSAVSKAFVGFGDLAAYIVGLVGGINVATSTEFYFNRNQTCFRGVINMAIKRKPVNTYRILKTAAV